MAVDMFLKLDGIKGESKDYKHKDEIHIESFSWGMSSDGCTRGGRRWRCRQSVGPRHLGHQVPGQSPRRVDAALCQRQAHQGRPDHGPQGRRKPLEYLKIKLTDILISSVQTRVMAATCSVKALRSTSPSSMSNIRSRAPTAKPQAAGVDGLGCQSQSKGLTPAVQLPKAGRCPAPGFFPLRRHSNSPSKRTDQGEAMQPKELFDAGDLSGTSTPKPRKSKLTQAILPAGLFCSSCSPLAANSTARASSSKS